jgi:CheY-like chemotaxis protein
MMATTYAENRSYSKRMPNVLVVDDAPVLQELFRSCLSLKGYHVQVAGNGLEALQQIEENMPDLILLDLMMPVMDGIEFAHIFRDRYKNVEVPIIVVTAADDARRRCQDIEAEMVLSKPFGVGELLDIVEEYVEHHPNPS